ncbi:MAG: DUF4194 domain-containing protein [Candidatus Aenigmatarchaeota archaeon]
MKKIEPYAHVILRLMKSPIYSEDQQWSDLIRYHNQIKATLEKIGLTLRYYDVDGFAFIDQCDFEEDDENEDNRKNNLPRIFHRIPLSFYTTILCVIIRDELRRLERDNPTGRPIISIQRIRDMMEMRMKPELKNDVERFNSEVNRLVNQVVDLGFLKRINDELYEIRPIIKAKIDTEMLDKLLEKLNQLLSK